MSDPTNPPSSGDNPYGQPSPPTPAPQPEQPFGQPYGQAPGQAPYGAPPAGQQPAYGSQPYGQPAAQAAGDPDQRPGTVTAASLITIIFSGLGLVVFGLTTLALLVARDDIISELESQLEGQAAFEGFSADDLATVLIVVCGIFALWCLVATVTAVLAMRGHNWARIVTVISAAVSAAFSLLAITSGLSALTLIASVAAIVLYFTGGAGDWYRRRGSDPSLPLGTTQPWG